MNAGFKAVLNTVIKTDPRQFVHSNLSGIFLKIPTRRINKKITKKLKILVSFLTRIQGSFY